MWGALLSAKPDHAATVMRFLLVRLHPRFDTEIDFSAFP